MTQPQVQLIVSNLCKQFQSSAETLSILQGVQFSLEVGQVMSIVGPSGCGKSTLLHILGTLDTPTSGDVQLGGVNPFSLSSKQLAQFRNHQIGFVFQDHHLLPQLSVVENVLLPGLAQGAATTALVQRADELIAAVGLAGRRDHLPAQLSGGERQRTAVARALLNQPLLLLADEPTGNLDGRTGQAVADLLFDLPLRQGAMMVMVTHSPELAQRADRRMRFESQKLIEG
ncbi:MAG TPA: ATP-binding protein [Planctomycetaceae bacterium]|nr:ATP-binding protein [Planctomycetaceae bacterium]